MRPTMSDGLTARDNHVIPADAGTQGTPLLRKRSEGREANFAGDARGWGGGMRPTMSDG